ncbi:MAG TPA: hypothetical protein VNZ49_02140 [Bacteroidia bacterium]|jgi:outer membrane lipoprotein-sorting protein|nr:hypothetical protein [Bacteroidia bacterium]
MKNLSLLLFFCTVSAFAQYNNGEELLKAMHKKYYGNYCQTVTFDQKTFRYDTNGVVKDTSYWYEWISYPDKFRIDFGKKFGGNCVIFKNDSVFNYRNNKLVKRGKDENDLLLLLGGMYYRPFEDIVARIERQGYNLDNLTLIDANGKMSYVIGSSVSGSENKYQIWVDKTTLRVEKIKTRLNENDWLEIRFDDFKKTCKGFTETKVTATKNDKLEQKEEYINLKTSVIIPDSIFNKK